jgi:hypothetical protein
VVANLSDAGTPFPLATGRGLKVAVIDSGVNVRHSHICAPTRGLAIGPGCGTDSSWEDTIGHGTAVMAAIQEKAPGAEFWALKLFGNSLRSTSALLLEAIEWTVANGMDIVNLSLGTPNLDYRADMQGLVGRANAAGVVLVSARRSGELPVLPGSLNGVTGVEVDWDLPRHRYRIESTSGTPVFFASGFPRSLPGVPAARNLNGVSFAVANMTGFVARACEGMSERCFERAAEALSAEARRFEAAALPLSP